MKAAVVNEYKEPLKIEQRETPEPGPDEVLIEVEASGVCHSDLHLAEGDWQQLKKITRMPLIPGHEVVGRVVEKGSDVTGLEIGDRVGVAWVHWTCGDCDVCREGLENLCPNQEITGCTVDGGYAEFMKARATHALKVPDGLIAAQAAPLFCAGVTVYRAIKKAEIAPGQRVAIFGIGGLGHLAVQIAKAFGAEVIAVDITDEKLELARSLGADRLVLDSAGSAAKEIRKAGGAHVAIVTAAARAAYDTAFRALKPTGTLVVVGLPSEPLAFSASSMSAGEIHIVASSVGTREDLREVLEMAAKGRLRCLVEPRALEEINEVFDEMKQAKITGRVVLKF